MKPVVFALPGCHALADDLAARLDADVGAMTLRRFPDDETYVRLDTDVAARAVVIVCTLDRPDEKLAPLLFTAAAARDLGAASVGLVAPYLAYLRQDRRFQAGEGVTSRYFARVLSAAVDWLVTVDPHLHRYASLAEIYTIPTRVVHATRPIAEWIGAHVPRALLIGPDAESAQWVAGVAQAVDAPWVVLQKTRRGDRDVEVSVPAVERHRERTPVLIDDIISTAHTQIAAVGQLRQAGLAVPVCIGVHAVFAENACRALHRAGVARVVTCNTIAHPSNAIDVTAPVAGAARELLLHRDPGRRHACADREYR